MYPSNNNKKVKNFKSNDTKGIKANQNNNG